MTSQPAAVSPARDQYARPLLAALLAGCAVALVLGLYAGLHHPAKYALDVGGFSSPLYAKAWLTTAAAAFAVVQLVTGSRLTRRPAAPAWMAPVHRWSGRIAILLTVPVIVHCVYALGFQTYSVRVLAHSVLGCVFYGAFVAKMLSLVRRDTMPRWVLPVLGGVVFASLIALWATSALWLFATRGVHS
ncbi:MAG TPA: DUF6529 family protein [Streptosporangiaceae bacterium]|jgi:hypothetical protein|nr:DUF6529 family protein [Streptosporangiaceae bacterium]